MSAITKVFERLKIRGEGALIGYITAGDPAPTCTPLLAEALINGGVDILELGLPFSDPIADGAKLKAASVRALKAGTTPKKVLEMAQEIKRKHDVPIVIMTYYNPLFRMGLKKFFSLSRECLVDGLIVPDLPVEEAGDYRKVAISYGVDTIFLAAPSTSAERLRRIVACSSGFLYLVSHFGVTGEKERLEHSTIHLVKHVLPFTTGHVPLAVGFGISKPAHVRSIMDAGADAVIVGSAFVKVVQKNVGNIDRTVAEIRRVAQKLKAAT